MPPKPKKPEGLRIRLNGLRTTAELRAMLHEAIDRLDDMAVTHIRGANLYLTPADRNGSAVRPLDATRRRITEFTIEGPYRSAAEEHGL